MPNPRERAQERLEAATGRGDTVAAARLEGLLQGPEIPAVRTPANVAAFAQWYVLRGEDEAIDLLRGARRAVNVMPPGRCGIHTGTRVFTYRVELAPGIAGERAAAGLPAAVELATMEELEDALAGEVGRARLNALLPPERRRSAR